MFNDETEINVQKSIMYETKGNHALKSLSTKAMRLN